MRWLRLRAVWLLVLPFLAFATPSPRALLVGGAITAPGLLLRAWSAGCIRKDRELSVSGPYAFVRHPLYLGSLLVGLGVAVAGGHWIWPVLFLAFFGVVYTRTMVGEARHLAERFPREYGPYAERVPAFLPRLTPYRPERWTAAPEGFSWALYRRNREWEALLGAVAAYAFLGFRVLAGGG